MAQRALYDKYKVQMYTLAFRITNNVQDAEDALQDGFMQVFKSIGSFKGNAQLGTWIHTIMARVALSKVKAQLNFTDSEAAVNEGKVVFDAPIDVQYLEQAILDLPEGYRAVFTLYEIEGFKHQEIGEMLDISVSTSKSQLHKAKRMLREKLRCYA